MGSIAAIAALIVGIAAIVYIWSVMTGRTAAPDDDVRRVDMGTNAYAAQQAHQTLREAGLQTRLVELEEGAFGIGLGIRHYLVYNSEDEAAVRTVVDELLDEDGFPIPVEESEPVLFDELGDPIGEDE